jgi:hypothetical protein
MAFFILILGAQMDKPPGLMFMCYLSYFVNNAYNILSKHHCLKYSTSSKHISGKVFNLLSQWSRFLHEMLTGA